MFHPDAHQRPTGERDDKRHDSDEQVFPDPWKREQFAVSRFTEGAIGENPAGVKSDRKPERLRPQPPIREDAANGEEGQETSGEEKRIGELREGMGDRNEAG